MNNSNPFFNFFIPFFDYVDSGKFFRQPFGWLYTFFAICNLLIPIIVLGKILSGGFINNFFEALYALTLFIVFSGFGWFGFQFWWNRKEKVKQTSTNDDDFVSTPVFSHFFQSLGEYYGFSIIILGVGIGFFTLLFSAGFEYSYRNNSFYNSAPSLYALTNPGFLTSLTPFSGLIIMVVSPIYGFLIVVVTRFLAEQFRALSSIANNTRRGKKTVATPKPVSSSPKNRTKDPFDKNEDQDELFNF